MRLVILFVLFSLASCNGYDSGHHYYDDGYYCDYCGAYVPPYHPPPPNPPPEAPCDRVDSWQLGYSLGYTDGADFGYCQGAPETDLGDYQCNTEYVNGYHAGCTDGSAGDPFDDTPPWVETG